MEPTLSDAIVLVTDPGPEVTAAMLVFAVALLGAVVGVMMARRGRVEALSLVGVFGLVMLASLAVLAHLPTRLVLDRAGTEVSFWGVGERLAWSQVGGVRLRSTPVGTFVAVTRTGEGGSSFSPLWPRWPGLLAPAPDIDARQIAMRVEAWRLAAGR